MRIQGSILSRLYNAHRHTAGREELEKVAEIFVRTFMEKIATRYTLGYDRLFAILARGGL